MASILLLDILELMKKLFLSSLLFLPQFIWACSTCNVDYTAEEKRGFVIATLLLIITPFAIGFFIFKYLKKNYNNEN